MEPKRPAKSRSSSCSPAWSGLEVDSATAGEIVAVAGIPDIGIGETIADANDPIALPPVTIDEPTVQMTFGVNNSPFAVEKANTHLPPPP